ARTHTRGLEPFHDIARRKTRSPFADQPVDLVFMRFSRLVRRKTGIRGPGGMFRCTAEREPFRVAEYRDDAPLVFTFAWIRPMRSCMRVTISLRMVNSSVHLRIEQDRCDELNA